MQVMVPYQDEYKFSLQKVVVAVEQARVDAVHGDALLWTAIENLDCLINVSWRPDFYLIFNNFLINLNASFVYAFSLTKTQRRVVAKNFCYNFVYKIMLKDYKLLGFVYSSLLELE